MAMTKKDYEAIAAVIAEERRAQHSTGEAAIVYLTIGLMKYFRENERFNADKFYDATYALS